MNLLIEKLVYIALQLLRIYIIAIPFYGNTVLANYKLIEVPRQRSLNDRLQIVINTVVCGAAIFA